MRKYLFYISLVFALVACQQTTTFKDADGAFAIAFKDAPVVTVDTFQTELGEVILHSFMEEHSNTNAQMITYSDYPVSENYIADPYKFIEGAKEGALKSLGINNLILDERITLDGQPGVEVQGTNNQNLYIHYKLFLKGSRLYQIGILKEGEEHETKDDLDFMESFVFL